MRTLTLMVAAFALAACAEAPTAPVEEAAPAGALASVSDARMMDLSIALADARSRLLPAMGQEQGKVMAAVRRLDERLAADDAAGVMEAAAQVEAALAAIPAGEQEAVLAELDALRLTLHEVRATAAGPATVQEQ